MMPTSDELRFAAEWLRAYDDESDQYCSAKNVAFWLDQQADAKDIREAAKAHGVPTARLRQALKVAA